MSVCQEGEADAPIVIGPHEMLYDLMLTNEIKVSTTKVCSTDPQPQEEYKASKF